MLGMVWLVALACGGAQKASGGGRASGLPADFDLEGEEQTVRHPAEGQGAQIDTVTLLARNRGGQARKVRVLRVERLHGSCDVPGWDDAQPLAVRAPAGEVSVAPGEEMRIAVQFDPVECYNACDRFAFRVHVELDGQPLEVEAALEVERGPDES
jgi:hypothetical protein